MKPKHLTGTLTALIFAASLALPAATLAQRDGDRPTPGSSGGSIGGPGMGGAAYGAGRDGVSFQMPQLDLSGSGANGAGRAGNLFGNRGSGQTERPTFGGFGGRSGGLLSDFDGDGTPDAHTFTPFGGAGGLDLQGRFGARGGDTYTLDGLTEAYGSGAFVGGGFGTTTELPALLDSLSTDLTTMTDANAEVLSWNAPNAYGDLSGLSEAQQNAQDAVNALLAEATTNVAEVSAATQERAEQAAAAAQQAYDQLWQDYYDAVDTTAQTYYDTVTATSDYLLQSYQEAVDYTTQAIDSYLVYADQYAGYCALYPWDCYSYAYDATVNTYVYVGDVSAAPVATVEIGDVSTQVTIPVTASPQPSADAYEAIVLFANDQLGATVTPRYAGDATDAVQFVIDRLPAEMQAYVANATALSGATYWALLQGGMAGVMVGDCTAGNCAITADNLDLHLSSSAAGIYGLLASGVTPATAEAALALITDVYPKLEGLAFAQVTDIDAGMAFTATAATLGVDPVTHQPVSAAKVVYAGVVDVDGQPFVYALVGVGEGYAGLLS